MQGEIQWGLPCAQHQFFVCHSTGGNEVVTFQWQWTGKLSLRGTEPEGKNQEEDKKEEEDKKAKRDMVSIIAFTQANLQHSIAASRVPIRTETWH